MARINWVRLSLSDVIEGACRHPPVKDRMDLTGARWGLRAAEAILKLRAIRSNGDFNQYQRHHLAQERRRRAGAGRTPRWPSLGMPRHHCGRRRCARRRRLPPGRPRAHGRAGRRSDRTRPPERRPDGPPQRIDDPGPSRDVPRPLCGRARSGGSTPGTEAGHWIRWQPSHTHWRTRPGWLMPTGSVKSSGELGHPSCLVE